MSLGSCRLFFNEDEVSGENKLNKSDKGPEQVKEYLRIQTRDSKPL